MQTAFPFHLLCTGSPVRCNLPVAIVAHWLAASQLQPLILVGVGNDA